MRKHCSDVCKFRPCLATESTNSARMRTIVTAALQRQHSQTELIFWITLVLYRHVIRFKGFYTESHTQICTTSPPSLKSFCENASSKSAFFFHTPRVTN